MYEQANRIYFMDSMRSTLMMLGVVLHSSNIFNTRQGWAIYSNETTVIANYIGQAIHVFRMPAFFVVAGFFCIFTLKKYKTKKFLAVRMKRLVIPLLVTGLTLNSLQAIILVLTGFREINLGEYVLDGDWVSHLWFLNNLIVYFLIAAVLAEFFGKYHGVFRKLSPNLSLAVPLIVILGVMPIVSVVIQGLNKLGFPLYSDILGVFRTHSMLIHLPYFVFGCVLAVNNNLLHKFSTINPIVILAAIVSSIMIMKIASFDNEIIHKSVLSYFEYLIVWLSISLCFYIFYRFFNGPSEKWKFLSDASYTVYLFHHVLVIGIGFLLIQLEIPPLLSMFVLILMTSTITLYIHKHVILKSRYARLLFNGK